MWAQWQGVRMLNCFVLCLYCLCRDHVYEARLRGELPGLKVTKWAHLDQDSHYVLWTTGETFHFCHSHAATWSCQPYLETAACGCCNMMQLVLYCLHMYYMPEASAFKYSACDTCTVKHAYWEGSICGHLSQSLSGAAKEVSATTGKAGAWPAGLAALPMNGAFVKGGSEDAWEVHN